MSSLISQVLNLLLFHAEVVRDLVQDGEADLPGELGGIGKITRQGLGEDGDLVGQYRRIDRGALGQGSPLIEAVKRILLRIQPQGLELALAGPPFHNDLQVVQTAAKLL